jgi:hypothetical protein
MIPGCLELPSKAEALVRSELRRAVTDDSLTVDDLRSMQAALDKVLAAYTFVTAFTLTHLQKAERLAPERLNAVKDALSALGKVRHEMAEHWPVCSASEEEVARAQIAGGESLDLDEAFARIAGLSKDAYLRRVEAHKAGRPAPGE